MKAVYRFMMMGFLAWACTLGVAQAATPTAQIGATVHAILDVLRAKDLDADAKRARISDLIDARFDFRGMAQRTLARNWHKASKAEKDRFTALYKKLLKRSYLAMVTEYTDQAVRFVDEKVRRGKYATVSTVIVDHGKEIPVVYRARLRKDGNWWIYDVVVEGVSLISNYRGSYQAIARKEGVSGLIDRLEQKLACSGC